MRPVVQVYEVERHMRYRGTPRWNWRLWLGRIKHATGPGFDEQRQALSAARKLCAALKDARVIVPKDRSETKMGLTAPESK